MNKHLVGLTCLLAALMVLGSFACSKAPTPTPSPAPKATPSAAPAVTPAPATTPTPTATPKAATSPAPVKAIELKFSHYVTTTHDTHVNIIVPFCQEFEQVSGGRVKVTIYPAETLGKDTEQYNLMKAGLADFAYFVPSYTTGVFPLSDVFTLPLSTPSATTGAKVAIKLLQRNDAMKKEYRDAQLLMIGITAPYQILTTKKQVKVLEDAKGLRVRSMGGRMTDSLNALGMAPVNISAAELYMALQKGTVDGAAFGLSTGATRKLFEVCPYVTDGVDMGTSINDIAMNKASFEKLPADLQSKAVELGQKYWLRYGEMYDKADKEARDTFGKNKSQVYLLPAAEKGRWVQKLAPIWSTWADELEKKGLPGKDFIKSYTAILAEEGVKLGF